jgi:hypothetical protein
VTPIDKLRSLAAALEAGQLPRTDIAQWAASAIQRGIDQGGSFEEVFGIGWANRLRARDEMIRQTYDRHFANQTPYVAAGRLERLAKDVTKLRAAVLTKSPSTIRAAWWPKRWISAYPSRRKGNLSMC